MTPCRLLYFALLLSLSSFTCAQATTPAKSSPEFSSVYTTLDLKACRPQGRGLDESSIYLCQGVGANRIKVNNNGCCFSYISILPLPYSTEGTELAFEFRQKTGFERSGRRVEWRVANGKPFAVILRLDETDEAHSANVLHRWLVVKGLRGFEKMAFKVDAKTPNAITKAKKYADKTYSDLLSLVKVQEISINRRRAYAASGALGLSYVKVQERSINLGESFSVDLVSSASAGIWWKIINSGAPYLEHSIEHPNSPPIPRDPRRVGGSSKTTHIFKAIQRGQVDVTFSQDAGGERDYSRSLTIHVTVK